MYLDQHTEAHRRFAAYQLTGDPAADFNDYQLEQLRQITESKMGSDERLQGERLSSAERIAAGSNAASRAGSSASAAASRYAANASAGASRFATSTQAMTAAEQLKFDREKLEKELAQQLELTRAANALNYLDTASKLRGPSNWLQAVNFYRNAPGAGTPAAFEALAKNQFLPQFGAQAGRPQVENMDTLIGKLTGGAYGTGGTDASGGLNESGMDALATRIGESPHTLAPGSLESLTEPEQGMLSSLLESKGYSMPLVLAGYTRSRPSQGDYLAA